jgi:hypothetical protein
VAHDPQLAEQQRDLGVAHLVVSAQRSRDAPGAVTAEAGHAQLRYGPRVLG